MKITLVNNNEGTADWEGLYVNNNLVAQNHSLSTKEVLDCLGLEYDEIEADVYLIEYGSLPCTLEEFDSKLKKLQEM